MPGRNGIVGLVCLAISVWLLFLTRGLPPAIMVPIGPAFYPRLVLSFMALLSVLLIAIDWRARRRSRSAPTAPTSEPAPAAHPNYPLVAATFVVFTLYVVLLPLLGFRIATVLFVAALQATLDWPRLNGPPTLAADAAALPPGRRTSRPGAALRRAWVSWRRWLRVVLVAIATTLICDLAFERYLSVLLPRGSWTGM